MKTTLNEKEIKKINDKLAAISNCINEYGEIVSNDPTWVGTKQIANDAWRSLKGINKILGIEEEQ